MGNSRPPSQYFMGSQAYLILLHFADVLCVLKSKDFWQLGIKAILLVQISQQHLLTSSFCVTF